MIFVRIAIINDIKYVDEIIEETEASAIARGTGISKRTPESVAQKMRDGKAVIALTSTGRWVGFSYLDIWQYGEFVSNSGVSGCLSMVRLCRVCSCYRDRSIKNV